MNHRILVAVDFSSLTERTIGYATELSLGGDRVIDLLHVTMSGMPDHMQANLPADLRNKLEHSEHAAAESRLHQLMATLVPEGHRGEVLVQRGHAADTICTIGAKGYDLVVISTQGRTGLKHVLLGSVAERVVRYATVPVLVVR